MMIDRAIVATRAALSRRRVSRTVVVALFATLLQIVTGSVETASAAGTPSVTMPAGGWVIGQNVNTTIGGATVSGLGTNDTYLITISLTGSISTAKLALPTTTGLTAAYGYTSGSNVFSGFTKISFTGIASDINTALNALQYQAGTAATSGTTPTISISAVENISGTAFNPTNGHYYRAVTYTNNLIPGTSYDNKQSTAFTYATTQSFAGQSGYLVTITSSDENTFVANAISNAANIWIGARDNASNTTGSYSYNFPEGSWGWGSPGSPEYGTLFWKSGTGAMYETSTAGGAPSLGYSNWCSGEPNNAGGENSGVTNWGTGSCWNDLPDQYSTVNGFVIEFGNNSASGGFTGATTSSAKVYIAPTLSRVSANNQIAQVSTAYPNLSVVQMLDAMGTAIPNATISWSASRGSVQVSTSTTDSSGLASQTRWTMPSTTGIDTLTASFSGAGNPTVSYTARVANYPVSNTDTDTAITVNGTKYATISNSSSLIPGTVSTVSLEAWIKPATNCDAAIACTIMTIDKSFLVQVVSGKIRYYIGSGSAWCDASASQNPASALTPGGQWTHVGFVRVNANVKIYINGTLRSDITSSCTPTTQAANTNSFVIGARGFNSEAFIGSIDEVRIWNIDRTSNIASDMHSNETSTSGLLNYWNFNEGAGAIAFNQLPSATSASDLTITDTTMWDAPVVSDQVIAAPYTTRNFYRSYITANGGWKVPVGVNRFSVLVVAGGGGGGAETDATGWLGGGGGAGGYQSTVSTATSGSVQRLTVGQGGRYGISAPTADANSGVPTNGQDSTFGNITSVGGGAGAGRSSNSRQNGLAGGSGGGGGTYNGLGGNGTNGQGNAGGAAAGSNNCCASGGGGGAGGAGGAATSSGSSTGTGGAAGDGVLNPMYISGSTPQYLAAGGAGGGPTSNGAVGTKGGVAFSASASANTGSGGGGGGGTSYINGGSGGSGIIIVRWITAVVPNYTKPVNAFLNVGMTETFTTNVMSDSATVGLTRTFRWESTTGGANGTFTLIKQGTGAANASFSWVPTDTSTSGSNYLYRLIVTDSDTAGLFITDSSTAFAIINRTLVMTGVSSIKKAINVARNDTYTITFGTPTYNVTLSPVIPGITLDTSTITSPVIRIADTATVGTYYETLTVTDSVSASVSIPLTIVISAPPNLLNTAEIVTNDLILNLDAGNSASLIADSGTATTGRTWNDLSGSKANAATGAGVNTGANGGTACTAPIYSSANAGSLTFAAGSNNCYYVSSLNPTSIRNNYTVEVWFKTSTSLPNNVGLMSQSFPTSNAPYFLSIGTFSSSALYVSFWDNQSSVNRFANCGYTPTVGVWTHIAGTYDGTRMSTYINGQLLCSDTITAYSPSGNVNNNGLIIGNVGNGSSTGTFPGNIASVRVYKSALNAAQLLSNFNATKARFDDSNLNALTPSKKYGVRLLDSFTVTSGSDTKTVAISVGNRAGLAWDTTTVSSVVNLTLQESLTPNTYLDTVTVTDALGQSTYVPLRITVNQADTITVSMDTATVITYNGSRLTVFPKPIIKGLVWTDSATSITRFASALYSETTTAPINADTYTVRGSDLAFLSGSLSNYAGVVYETTTATINKARQNPLNIYLYGGVVGMPYLISLQGGNGTGAVTETLTGVSSLAGCSISNRYLSATEQKQGFCEVRVVKAGDQNYFAETQTAQMYFMDYQNQQSSTQVGSGATIALNGITSYVVDTTTPPSITGLSTLTLSLSASGNFTITGTGFNGTITVKFWRNKIVTTTSGNGTSIVIPISTISSIGATTGRIAVATTAGQDFSVDILTITP